MRRETGIRTAWILLYHDDVSPINQLTKAWWSSSKIPLQWISLTKLLEALARFCKTDSHMNTQSSQSGDYCTLAKWCPWQQKGVFFVAGFLPCNEHAKCKCNTLWEGIEKRSFCCMMVRGGEYKMKSTYFFSWANNVPKDMICNLQWCQLEEAKLESHNIMRDERVCKWTGQQHLWVIQSGNEAGPCRLCILILR